MNRPTGVTILAVLNLIGGILGTLVSLVALLFGGLALVGGAATGSAEAAGAGALLLGLTIIVLINSILALVASYGLFTLKGWAWILTLVLQIISIATNLLKVIQGQGAGGAILSIAIAGVILYYLMQPNVKRAFGKA